MAKERGLGRGLGSLLGILDDEEEVMPKAKKKEVVVEEKPVETPKMVVPEGETVREIEIGLIDNNPNQPRKNFDANALNELSQSIKLHGIIQPILVTPKNGRYMIVAGERRFRACKLAEKKTIPCIVKDLEEGQIKEIALLENIQRQDLNPIETARAMQELLSVYGWTQEELADRLGKSRSAVANALRLLTLTPPVIELIEQGKLSAGHARSLVVVTNPEVQLKLANQVMNNKLTVRDMENAVKNDEFFVMYQPKIELSTDKIIGAEALVRWNSSDPELGFLSPAKFIPLFEKNGFIEELDFIVYEKVFEFLRNQIDIGNNVVPISVNMSRNHTKQDKINNFISRFVSTFNKYNLSPDLVEVEILEQSVAADKIILQQVIDALHNNGFSIAMDDFGSGESSLNMLSSIPIDVVKFDQNFLRNNSSLEESSDFITSLVDLGKKLNKKTVFEGVETKEQRDFLRSINCDVVQGYFYSKPLSENDFIQFVKDHI